MTRETVSALADTFTTSLTDTAIRLIELGSYPRPIVVADVERVRWFRRGPDIPKSLGPRVPGRKAFILNQSEEWVLTQRSPICRCSAG
jgi:hypothetical protein